MIILDFKICAIFFLILGILESVEIKKPGDENSRSQKTHLLKIGKERMQMYVYSFLFSGVIGRNHFKIVKRGKFKVGALLFEINRTLNYFKNY